MIFRSLLLALFMGSLGFSALAQPAEEPDAPGPRYDVHAGPLLTTLGLGVSGGFAVEINRHVFTLRGTSTSSSLGSETWDVGFLYGRALHLRSFILWAGSGVAVVGGRRYPSLFGRGSGEPLETMMGFPLEGAVFWTPASVLAIGVRGIANVNTGQPFGGLGLMLRVGKIR